MNEIDIKYMRDVILPVMYVGERITTRNSTVRRLTCVRCEFDSTPLISLRKTAWKNALREWEWFMSGSNNINQLHESVRPWWQPWADKNGFVWNNYSNQFREWYTDEKSLNISDGFDQIEYLVDGIRDHPYSRRNVITTWNTSEMASKDTPITNCHGTIIQAFVTAFGKLDLFMYQRSVDVICGLSHNWIQYWAFLLWLCQQTGRRPGKFIWLGGDVHIYEAHYPIVEEMLKEWAKGTSPKLTPQLIYNPGNNPLPPFRADHFTLDAEYVPIITTKAEMIV